MPARQERAATAATNHLGSAGRDTSTVTNIAISHMIAKNAHTEALKSWKLIALNVKPTAK